MTGLQLALRAAVAAGVSIALAGFFKLEQPIYALIAAVIVTDLQPARTSKRGLQRVVSTVVGASCGAAFREVLPQSAWAIGLGILSALLICHMSWAREGSKVAGYICGVVMLAHGEHAWSYAFRRLLETLMGIGIAWLISFVPKLISNDNSGSLANQSDTSLVTKRPA